MTETYCHRCSKQTLWQPNRTNTAEHCTTCNDRFPCQSKTCQHHDCEDYRNEKQAP